MLMLNIFDDAGTIMLGWLRIAMMSIIANVYNLIATFYNIFMYIVKVNILSGDNESLVRDIYNRIQVILAVVMVFYVTLEFVKYIVNPDTFSDKEKGGGGLLKRILIVILLMAFTPQIFGIAYDFQGRIISSEVIPKVLIKNYNPTDFDDNAGGAFSSNLLAMFYKPYVTSEGNIPSGKCGDKRSAQQVVNDNLRVLETKGKMVNATYCIAEAGGDVIADGEKHVNPYLIEMGIGGLLPLVIGCFMIWVLVNYCAEAGRVIIQFVFLQIIAPIPILSYVAPGKDGMFNKWVKQCTTTYLDLFIRLFIMYLILMLSQILIKVDINTLFGTFDFPKGSWMPLWIKLFLFIGLCLFALKAPKMVKELLPGGGNAASGDFGFSGKSVARTAGAALGAGWGGLSKAGKLWKNNVNRNAELKDRLRSKGLPTDRKNLREERRKVRSSARSARDDLRQARREYDEASRNNNKAGMVAAQKKLESASKNFVTKDEERALLDKSRTKNAAIAAAGGLITGTLSGGVAGLKQTKITEFRKTIDNVNKTVDERITKSEKWVNAGVMNIFERTKARVLNAFPNATEPELVKQTLKQLKTDASNFDKLSKQEIKVDGAIGDLGKQIESKVTKGGKSLTMESVGISAILNKVSDSTVRKSFEDFLLTCGYDSATNTGTIELGNTLRSIEAKKKQAEAKINAAAASGNAKQEAIAKKEYEAALLLDEQLKKQLTDRAALEVSVGAHDKNTSLMNSLENNKQNVLSYLMESAQIPDISSLIKPTLIKKGKTQVEAEKIYDMFIRGEVDKLSVEEFDDLNNVLKELSGLHSREASSRNSFVSQYDGGYAATQVDELNAVTGGGKSGK